MRLTLVCSTIHGKIMIKMISVIEELLKDRRRSDTGCCTFGLDQGGSADASYLLGSKERKKGAWSCWLDLRGGPRHHGPYS